MQDKKILIVGEVFVDVFLHMNIDNHAVVRLGGIFHSARACDALHIPYAMAYYAPTYLNNDIKIFSQRLNSSTIYQLGYIDQSPNVMLISDAKETGNQEYDNLLRNQVVIINTNSLKSIIDSFKPTDILVYPGRYDIKSILKDLKDYLGKVHIDFHYNSEDIIKNLDFKIETAILSTSSEIFRNDCHGSSVAVKELFSGFCSNILLKENRGGSCFYSYSMSKLFDAPSYIAPIMHSVGVGDCFNAIFCGIGNTFSDYAKKLKIASICSSLYACTLNHDEFIYKVGNLNLIEVSDLGGIRLSWEERERKNIYIAAPDFPNVDVSIIDKLCENLKYHNFKTHRPIKENGLITQLSTYDDRNKIYQKDIALINLCDLMISVLLYNDPGTLVEMGMFKQMNKPIILFDPYKISKNMFLQNSSDFICYTTEDVIDKVFLCFSRKEVYNVKV